MWKKKSAISKDPSQMLPGPAPKKAAPARRLPCASALAAAFLLAACASTPTGGPAPLAELEKRSSVRQEMSGTLLLTTQRNGKSVTAPAVLLLQYPDKLRLELQDPVGSTLALLVIEADRFWLYQKNRKENLTGPLRLIPADFRFPFSGEELVRLFLARPYWSEFQGSKVGEGNTLTRTTKQGREMVAYDSRELTPVSWGEEGAGFPAATAQFEEYEARDGARYPTRIRLKADEGGREVLLVWKDWQASVNKTKNLFEIPPAYDFGRPTKALR